MLHLLKAVPTFMKDDSHRSRSIDICAHKHRMDLHRHQAKKSKTTQRRILFGFINIFFFYNAMGVRKFSILTTNDQVLLELTKTNPHRAHHRQITGFDKEICNESFVVRTSPTSWVSIHDPMERLPLLLKLQSFHAWAFHVYTYIICIYI